VLTSLIALTTVYSALAVIEVFLIARAVRAASRPPPPRDESVDQLEFAY
jgi:cytochrome d ubiquinol oxidase subunit I